MVPKRKAYLAKCSEREKWLRENIGHWQGLIQGNKWALNNDKQFTEDDKLYCLSHIRKYKYQVSAYRHELARLKRGKGVVPVRYDDCEEISYAIVGTCPECGTHLFGDGTNNYCHYCGRRVLWEKMKY